MKKHIVLLIIITLAITSCKKSSPYEESYFALGTVVNISIRDHGSDELLTKCFDLLDEIEQNMSTSIADSDISQINQNAGLKPVTVSNDTAEVINRGIYYGDLSKGNFDISIEPLVKLWNIGTGGEVVPDENDITEAINNVDYKKIKIEKKLVSILSNMELDLGGIAKGYAADRIKELLKSEGVTSALINIGGNILVLGEKSGNNPFNVGIQNPFSDRNNYVGILSIKDRSIVSSGDYERYFEVDGTRYHHIFDVKTGYPIVTNIASVSVITTDSFDADALSTIFFSMDIEEGFKLADRLGDVSLIYITKNNTIYISEEISAAFKLTDVSFELIVK